MSYFAGVVGQADAVRQLEAASLRPVHAYMFVGPAGAGKRVAAHAFAATLLDDERPMRGVHPDVVTVERDGASISVAQAREISRLAARTPTESPRKVLILDDFHLVDDAAPALLKTIEEAPQSTIFIVLAESIPKSLVTVASRCVQIEFRSLTAEAIARALEGEGVARSHAVEVAEVAKGNLERARLLAADPLVSERQQMWSSVLDRLDGTGATAAVLADEVVSALDKACEPLASRHDEERAELEAAVKEKQFPGGALKELDTRHKREIRRLRTDELRSGLATIAHELGVRFQSVSNASEAAKVQAHLDAVQKTSESIAFNPGELLMLQGLFSKLSR
jgi:DNA polymerase III subunit delta'